MWRRRAIMALLLTGLLAGVVYAGPPAYRASKRWLAGLRADKAARLLAAGDAYRALIELRRAHLLAPTEPKVLRAAAEFYAAQDNPMALQFLASLAGTRAMKPADRLRMAELALRFGSPAIATEQLDALISTPLTPDEVMRADLMRTELVAATESAAPALIRAREALRRAEAARVRVDEARLLLARVLLAQPAGAETISMRAEATGLLRDIARTNRARPGLDALQILARTIDPAADPQIARQISEGLDSHPQAGPSGKLLATELRIRADPGKRTEEIDRLEGALANAPERVRLQLARWLVRNRESDRVLRMAGKDLAEKSEDWCLVRLDAFATQGRWEEIEEALRGPNRLLPSQVQTLFLARCARELGKTSEASALWIDLQRDLRIADGQTALYVAQYAERLGEKAEAAAAYRRLIRVPETTDVAMEGYSRCADPAAPAAQARTAISDFLAVRPNNPAARSDFAYLSLLMGQRVSEAAATAADLLRNDPSRLAYRTVAALAALREDNPARALAVYGDVHIDWDQAPAPWRVVRAAVLRASGREAEGNALLVGIQPSTLRPEERDLVGW